VQNAIQFLKMIGALDENENLTHLGMYSIEEKNNLFHENLYCFYDVFFTSYIYDLYSEVYKLYLRHFFTTRQIFSNSPCGSQAWENAHYGYYFPLL